MAYSPVEQGRLPGKLEPLARRRGVSPAQVALAWLLRQKGLIVIPKASNPEHVRENRAAEHLSLVIDLFYVAQNQVRGRRDKYIEIDDAPILPEERKSPRTDAARE